MKCSDGTPGDLLDELMAAVGEPPAAGEADFAGSDPVFPTLFRIGDLGAATIAACAVQAARLWRRRTGRDQRVLVEVDAAAAAMRSSRYIRSEADPDGRPPVGGGGLPVYPTRDGRWIYFQRLFPHHRARFLSVLGCPDDDDSIARAVGTWDGSVLEEAVVAAGATAGLIRTHREWAKHEQGMAVANQPLLEVLKVAEGAPEPLPEGSRPLSGIRVLDLTRVLAGPTCGRTLAEHGADVLRVGTTALPDNEAMMRDTGHGKRSCALDLRSAAGAGQLRALIRRADVFVEGYRPGAIARLGFSPESVMSLRPGIVYASISAFGHAGPWRDRRGFDSVVQAVSGMADEVAQEGKPGFLPANPLDYAAGYLAAFGVMVALSRRTSEGGSFRVRASLARTGHWLDELGRVDPVLSGSRPPDLAPERRDELMISRDTPFGRLRYLAPVAQLSETPARWDGETVPLDHDRAAWW